MGSDIEGILARVSHRPYALPEGEWGYYQEWNHSLFLHWEIPFEVLRAVVPIGLDIDNYRGSCYVSLVAFTMQKIRPAHLISFKPISDFQEVNLRTYVENGKKRGVYFLSIEAGNSLSVFIAKNLSDLPYTKSDIRRSGSEIHVENTRTNHHLDVEFEIGEEWKNKNDLDRWLTERYCLYLLHEGQILRYDIHHEEWPLKQVVIKDLKLKYKVGNLGLPQKQDFAHYSEGVKVITWPGSQI